MVFLDCVFVRSCQALIGQATWLRPSHWSTCSGIGDSGSEMVYTDVEKTCPSGPIQNIFAHQITPDLSRTLELAEAPQSHFQRFNQEYFGCALKNIK